MREDHQVAYLAGLIADVILQQRLGLEAVRAEHANCRLLVGDDFDNHLREAEAHGCQHGATGEGASDAAAAVARIDDHTHFAHVARPTLERHDGSVAEDAVPLDRQEPSVARPGPNPRGTHLGVFDVLLEERPVTFRDALQKSFDRLLVSRLERSDLHHRSFGGLSSSLCAAIHSASAGRVCLNAWRPVAKVTWPPPSRSSSRRAGSPTSCVPGSVAVTGTTLSFSANAQRTLADTFSRSITRPPRRIRPVMSTLRRTISSTTWRKAAPGKGTCSRDHWAIAW